MRIGDWLNQFPGLGLVPYKWAIGGTSFLVIGLVPSEWAISGINFLVWDWCPMSGLLVGPIS